VAVDAQALPMIGQRSAIDPDQIATQDRTVKGRELRRRDLWQWLMREAMGREFFLDVLLADLQHGHAIGVRHEAGELVRRIALHDLAVAWVEAARRAAPRDQYYQMLKEAEARDKKQRQTEETQHQVWTQREEQET